MCACARAPFCVAALGSVSRCLFPRASVEVRATADLPHEELPVGLFCEGGIWRASSSSAQRMSLSAGASSDQNMEPRSGAGGGVPGLFCVVLGLGALDLKLAPVLE